MDDLEERRKRAAALRRPSNVGSAGPEALGLRHVERNENEQAKATAANPDGPPPCHEVLVEGPTNAKVLASAFEKIGEKNKVTGAAAVLFGGKLVNRGDLDNKKDYKEVLGPLPPKRSLADLP
eukprot:jgi/Mesvir1/3706/Mv14992-RA.1